MSKVHYLSLSVSDMEQSTPSQLSCLIIQSVRPLGKDPWTILFPGQVVKHYQCLLVCSRN